MSRRKPCWYKLVANAILEKGTFELPPKDSGEGFRNIHEVIADHILRDHTKRQQYELFASYVACVKAVFDAALDHLEECGTKVYRIRRSGGKGNIVTVTTDARYKDAESGDLTRAESHAEKYVRGFAKHVKRHKPELLPTYGGNFAKLLSS